MSTYPFEYFCGANVVVYIEEFPLLEACGFSFSVRESKRPLYGYASRLYDGVARGQVLVEGTLLINYVHHDYLFRAAEIAIGATDEAEVAAFHAANVQELSMVAGEIPTAEQRAAAQAEFWDNSSFLKEGLKGVSAADSYNLHDGGSFSVRVGFGDQTGSRPQGDTGFLITGLHFTGRAQTIQIDAETVVEAYSFFARNVYTTANPAPPAVFRNDQGETAIVTGT